MLNDENIKLCWEILARYGVEHQMMMVVEESAELQKAICKIFRNEDYIGNFQEELVDVIVVCQQMLLVTGMRPEEVNRRAKEKIERALGTDGV